LLAIEAHDLLLMGNDACLQRGLDPAAAHHPGDPRVDFSQQTDQTPTRGVGADDTASRGSPPESTDVVHDIRRASEAEALIGHPHHRHRRLRGNAVHSSPDELIEDQIAHDQDSHAAEAP